MDHDPLPRFETIAYGHNAEDIVLLRAFAGRRDGFFVDVGAGEPDRWSLTKNLVERLGWRGVNIEPLPERFQRLVNSRPNDVNLEVAVGCEAGVAVFHRILAATGLQTVGTTTVDPEPVKPDSVAGLSTLRPDIVATHRKNGRVVEELNVKIVTLESILQAYAEPGFDLLKVDVEGSEASVLASADLGAWRPRVIVVEATRPETSIPAHTEWEPALLKSGYSLALFDGLNRFYARDDEQELRDALSVPANVIDRYIPSAYASRLGITL